MVRASGLHSFEGCPLTCLWCHNPEGQSRQIQVIQSPAGDRISGRVYTPIELASLLNQQVDILNANEGGITFSGGEPLLQVDS
jgi:pyruvate formate lyase activating enzyme